MSSLNDIVTVNITRQTTAVSRASFGTIAIISEFETTKTTTVFDRYRYYADLTEMSNDGWGADDFEYKAAQVALAQNPKVTRIMVGRIDSADANVEAGLNAIQTAQSDWYGVVAIGAQETKVIFDADLITGNLIDFTINDVAVTQVPFNTSHSQTMADIKTQIETDITNSSVTIDTRDPDSRTLLVKVEGKQASVSTVVTGGASQAGSIVNNSTTKVVFDADFVASNSIVFTINGTAITAVPYNASQSTTMDDLKAQIETDLSTAIATIDASDGNTRTMLIDVDKKVAAVSVEITGGISQPGSVISTNVTDIYKDVAAWTETQKKIFFLSSSLEDIKGPDTDDIISYMKSQNYDRTLSTYNNVAQGDEVPEWFESGWPGKTFPSDPGSINWAYKTISGITSYELTSSERTNILNKYGNIYTSTAGVDITEQGRVASGEWVDVIRGIDWIESRLQEDIFAALVNSDKIPYTDEGATIIGGIVEAVLNEAAANGILIAGSIDVTVPEVADISSTDKANRILPDVEFTALLQGAINSVEIQGTVSL